MSDSPASAVSIARAPPRSLAAIGAFGDPAALRAALAAEFAVSVPTTPAWVRAGTTTLACLAPARYLAAGPREADLPAHLAAALAGLAAVTDQSDMWDTFVVSGEHVHELLARVVPVELGAVGALALTRAGHLDVRVCRIAELDYEVSAWRSYGPDLLHALTVSKQALLF